MQLQLDAALDSNEFDELCGRINQAGLEIQKNEVLLANDQPKPLAWALVASRVS